MKDYKESKKAKNSVLSKKKIVTIPAVEEVKDSKGVVIQAKVAEESYNEIVINKKAYSPDTGKAIDDIVYNYRVEDVDTFISDLKEQIDRLTAEKESWEAIKADFEALK